MDTEETIGLVEYWDNRLAGRPEGEIVTDAFEDCWEVWSCLRYGEVAVVAKISIRRHRGLIGELLLVLDFGQPAIADRLIAYREGQCVFDVWELIELQRDRLGNSRSTVEAVTIALAKWLAKNKKLSQVAVQHDFFLAQSIADFDRLVEKRQSRTSARAI